MKKALTAKQIQKLDKTVIEKIGIPSLVLMENAGKGVAQQALRRLREHKNPFVCIVCGLGNNAGDGLVAARHLKETGIRTKVYLIAAPKKLKKDAFINYSIFRKLKGQMISLRKVSKMFIRDIKRANVIIDAIFGVGLNRPVKDPFKSVIERLNNCKKTILSVDVPSGLDATTGKIYGVCVKADLTVTFSFTKKGFFKNEGPRHVGKAVVIDIGVPKKLVSRV